MNKKFDVNDIVIMSDTSKIESILEYEEILLCISKRIYAYRKENNMTQNDLAKLLNVKQEMISKLESGHYNPTFKLIHDISKKIDNTNNLFIQILQDIINSINNMYVDNYSYKANKTNYHGCNNIQCDIKYTYKEIMGGVSEYEKDYFSQNTVGA